MTNLFTLTKKTALYGTILAFMGLGSFSAKAEVAFDTLDPLRGGVGGAIVPVTSYSIASVQQIATPFSPIFDISLTSISPYMKHFSGEETYKLSLFGDNAGAVDTATLLGSVTRDVPASPDPDYFAFDFSEIGINLLAGTQYWAVLDYNGSDTDGGIGVSDEESLFGFSFDDGVTFGYDTNLTPVILVEGDRVDAPEPAALILLGQGLAFIGFMAMRRRKD